MKLIKKVRIDSIIVEDRFRKDLGNLESLAESIDELGQLQPIGVTKDNRLVYGGRRLAALRDLLQRVSIDAVEVDLDDLIRAEHDENELRKDFTPEERLAIAAALKEKHKPRQGQRYDLELPGERPEVTEGETRDLVAKQSGFGSARTMAKSEEVIEHAEQPIKDAMNTGEISINMAHEISKLPPEVQQNVDDAKQEVARLKEEAKKLNREIDSAKTQIQIATSQKDHQERERDKLQKERSRLFSDTYEPSRLLEAVEEHRRQNAIFMIAVSDAEDLERHPESVVSMVDELAGECEKIAKVLRNLYRPTLSVIEGGAE